jgi:aldose 1-epimerase
VLELADATGHTVVRVHPDLGGRIGSIHTGGHELLVAGDASSHPMQWGSFPMAPWAGRVRFGRFVFDGEMVTLPLDLPPHAIHGSTYRTAWEVAHLAEHRVVLTCPLEWSFGGVAEQVIRVGDGVVTCELALRAGDRAMPGEVGWHPWFLRPDSLVVRPQAMYRRDADGIPDGTLVEPPPGPWDDCFVHPDPATLEYASHRVTVSSDCEDVVLYTHPEHAVCVEPQSGPPDAFTLRPRRIEPGTELRRTMAITARPR